MSDSHTGRGRLKLNAPQAAGGRAVRKGPEAATSRADEGGAAGGGSRRGDGAQQRADTHDRALKALLASDMRSEKEAEHKVGADKGASFDVVSPEDVTGETSQATYKMPPFRERTDKRVDAEERYEDQASRITEDRMEAQAAHTERERQATPCIHCLNRENLSFD